MGENVERVSRRVVDDRESMDLSFHEFLDRIIEAMESNQKMILEVSISILWTYGK